MKIKGYFIDCCQLRNQTYAQDSRIPQITVGTAKSDAFRRDLTINALFYNILTAQIEDFTEKGLEDLKQGIIRTPLEPKQTYLDDPLRILRTIRFATRFNYKINDDIYLAATDPVVQLTLKEKVSYERIGKELQLMFKGKNPYPSVKLFKAYNILPIIMKFPQDCKPLQDPQIADQLFEKSVMICKILGLYFDRCRMVESVSTQPIVQALKDCSQWYFPHQEKHLSQLQFRLFQAGMLCPFRSYNYKVRKNVEEMVPQYVAKKSLVNPNKVVQDIKSILIHISDLQEILKSAYDRLTIGKWLRKVKQNWIGTILLTIAQQYSTSEVKTYSETEETKEPKPDHIDTGMIEKIELKYTELITYIYHEDLLKSIDMKPMLNGTEVMELLNIKQGKRLKIILDDVVDWQIKHKGTKEELSEYLIDSKEKYI